MFTKSFYTDYIYVYFTNKGIGVNQFNTYEIPKLNGWTFLLDRMNDCTKSQRTITKLNLEKLG